MNYDNHNALSMKTCTNILASIGSTRPLGRATRRETRVAGWMFSRNLSGSLSKHQTGYTLDRLLVGR